MKYASFFLVIGSIAVLCSCGAKNEIPTDNKDHYISDSSLASALQYLSSDALEGRETGTAGIEKAAQYIEERFENNGLAPYFTTYRDSFDVDGKIGYNLVGFKEGSDPILKNEFIIIGAHYDHVGIKGSGEKDNVFNGANDNATGTTAVLELSKYLADKELKRSILFTLFSAEEMGLVGSRKLAQRLASENIDLYTLFNIEMVGVPMVNKEYLAYVTGYHKSNIADKFNDYAGAPVLGYLAQAESYNLFKRSDNYPFFEAFNIPAHTISTFDFSNYAFYHKAEDEFELMDLEHMTKLVKALVPGLVQMANAPEKQIILEEE